MENKFQVKKYPLKAHMKYLQTKIHTISSSKLYVKAFIGVNSSLWPKTTNKTIYT